METKIEIKLDYTFSEVIKKFCKENGLDASKKCAEWLKTGYLMEITNGYMVPVGHAANKPILEETKPTETIPVETKEEIKTQQNEAAQTEHVSQPKQEEEVKQTPQRSGLTITKKK